MYKHKNISALEIKNDSIHVFVKGSEKTTWQSNRLENDTILVIAESAIDAMSYHIIHNLKSAFYIAVSGSFSKQALSQFMQTSSWSDMTLIAGDLGRNSETATLLESYVQTYTGPVTITQDAADYFKETPSLVVDRPNTLLVLTLAQLQRIFIATPSITPITYSMSSVALAEALHEYTIEHPIAIMTLHNGLVFAAHEGRIVTSPTESNPPEDAWRVKTASKASVYWMQNPNKLFESVATSLHVQDS